MPGTGAVPLLTEPLTRPGAHMVTSAVAGAPGATATGVAPVMLEPATYQTRR